MSHVLESPQLKILGGLVIPPTHRGHYKPTMITDY